MPSQIAAVSLQDLREIVGAEHARETADRIDGVPVRFVVEPGTLEEAAAVLRLCNEAGLAVLPRGAGTKIAWGNPPERADVILSTVRLNRMLEHAVGDLVIRVQAGMPVERLQEIVGGAGQQFSLDPTAPGSTVGGIVATNDSGARRLRYGTIRDLLIGITYVLADGTIAHAGGKVVKNVAGYDLGKLFTGSLGTLGLIGEVILRLQPKPPAIRLVGVSLHDLDALAEAVQRLMYAQIVPSAMEFGWERSSGALVVVFESIESGVSVQAKTAQEVLHSYGEPRLLEAGDRELWTRLTTEPWQGGAAALKVAVRPMALPDMVRAVYALSDQHGLTPRIVGHAATSVMLVRFDRGDARDLVPTLTEIRQRAAELGGSAVILHAAPDVKSAVDVWGSAGDALPLMRHLKERFDPRRTLNPGRFVGGI